MAYINSQRMTLRARCAAAYCRHSAAAFSAVFATIITLMLDAAMPPLLLLSPLLPLRLRHAVDFRRRCRYAGIRFAAYLLAFRYYFACRHALLSDMLFSCLYVVTPMLIWRAHWRYGYGSLLVTQRYATIYA